MIFYLSSVFFFFSYFCSNLHSPVTLELLSQNPPLPSRYLLDPGVAASASASSPPSQSAWSAWSALLFAPPPPSHHGRPAPSPSTDAMALPLAMQPRRTSASVSASVAANAGGGAIPVLAGVGTSAPSCVLPLPPVGLEPAESLPLYASFPDLLQGLFDLAQYFINVLNTVCFYQPCCKLAGAVAQPVGHICLTCLAFRAKMPIGVVRFRMLA